MKSSKVLINSRHLTGMSKGIVRSIERQKLKLMKAAHRVRRDDRSMAA